MKRNGFKERNYQKLIRNYFVIRSVIINFAAKMKIGQ